MKANTNTLLILLAAIAALFQNAQHADVPAIQRTEIVTVRGGIAFPPEKRMWNRIVGKVKVLDAHTLVFGNGTEVNLLWNMDAPDLEQKGMRGGSLYPAGKEAAAFLRGLIKEQRVTFIGQREDKDGKRVRGTCFVGEKNLEIEMVRNGWAISDHEGMDPWEIIAREKKRGLWRGQFLTPRRWRKGERLPGE
jgi:endonuclease YncB( thermonuclease family)